MSRRRPPGPRPAKPARGKPPGEASASRGARPARSKVGPGRWWLAAVLLAGVVALALHPWRRIPAADPLAGVTMRAAADSADRLVARGKFSEALPYIARIERFSGGGTADFEALAATATNNATIQVREQNGLVIPMTRSSIERVGLLRESLIRLGRAEEKATSAERRRNIIVARGGQLAVWGFVREAYADYQRGASIQPLNGRMLSEAGWIEKMLSDPTQVIPPAPLLRDSLDASARVAPTGR